jgi:SAM-dependent methyltransferase
MRLPSFFESCHLFFLHFYVKWWEWRDRQKIDLPAFQKLDQRLRQTLNPYKVQQAFPYGETPLAVLKEIADRFGLKPSDTVIELGCGRGRAAFFWAHYVGCRVYGIDKIPEFISLAQQVAQNDPHLSFSCEDISAADLQQATWIYLYGTGWDETLLDQIAAKIPPSAKIVSVTTPLNSCQVQDQFLASFPWGKADIYLLKRI